MSAMVSNHQPYDCLLKLLFRPRSKETPKVRVTDLCAGNSPVTGEFPAQRASNAENVSIRWRHHVATVVVARLWWAMHILGATQNTRIYRSRKGDSWLPRITQRIRLYNALLLTGINWTAIEIKTWMSNYIHVKQWGVITHPCPNFIVYALHKTIDVITCLCPQLTLVTPLNHVRKMGNCWYSKSEPVGISRPSSWFYFIQLVSHSNQR